MERSVKTKASVQRLAKTHADSRTAKILHTAAVSLLLGFLIIGVLSTCSPLYTFNPWPDANIFLTVAREMKHGKMLYRDVFDHKGPYLYLIYMGGTFISEWTFHGVYVLEALAASAYIYLALIRAPSLKKAVLAFMGCLAVYTSASMAKGGSAEEFCLPLLFALVFVSNEGSAKELFVAGILAGLIFWIKFTICTAFIGWGLFILIRYKTKVLKSIPFAIIGFLAASIPAAVMFFGNYNVLFDGYLASNLFYGTHLERTALHVYPKVAFMGVGISALMTVIAAVKSKEKRLFLILFMAAVSIPCFLVAPSFIYYWLPVGVFAPLWSDNYQPPVSHILAFLIPMAASAIILGNVMHIGEHTPQERLAEIIRRDPGPVYTYETMDYGLYTLAHQRTNERFFFQPNMLKKDIVESQKKAIHSGKYKYIVSWDGTLGKDLAEPLGSFKDFDTIVLYRAKNYKGGKV